MRFNSLEEVTETEVLALSSRVRTYLLFKNPTVTVKMCLTLW